jgi:membrane protein DedA with SNARE-associated domain
MFFIGMRFDKKIIETGKLKYINIDMIMKVEHWFQKWGYWVIVINRFLSGTRAVISFFAGMSLLDTKKTTILSFLGALVWNFILIYLGMIFGENWREIYAVLERMGYYLFAVLLVVALGVFLFHRIKKSN